MNAHSPNAPAGASPIAALRALAGNDKIEDAMARDIDKAAFAMRLAGALNLAQLAKAHARTVDWSAEDAEGVIDALAAADRIAGQASASVPAGFGPLTRTENAVRLVKLAGAKEPQT